MKKSKKRRGKEENLKGSATANVLQRGDLSPPANMNDHELRQVLDETWPIRPGQEARAWSSLQQRLGGKATPAAVPFFTWSRLLVGGCAVALLALLAIRMQSPAVPSLSAASQSPGIFATAFYSQPARAQVVWLNGMDPATDGPTYMDPTTRVRNAHAAAPSALKSDRL